MLNTWVTTVVVPALGGGTWAPGYPAWGRGRVVRGGRGALLLRGQLRVEAAPSHIAPCSPGHCLVIAGGHGGHLETIDTLLSNNGVMTRMSSLTCCT